MARSTKIISSQRFFCKKGKAIGGLPALLIWVRRHIISYCNQLAISHHDGVKFLARVLAMPLASLIALLSFSSVSTSLHDSIFHGKEGCPHHAAGHHPCSSHEERDEPEGQEEIPCPMLLIAKGFLPVDCQPSLTFSNVLVSEPDFFVSPSNWVSRKRDPFGARDPPVCA